MHHGMATIRPGASCAAAQRGVSAPPVPLVPECIKGDPADGQVALTYRWLQLDRL